MSALPLSAKISQSSQQTIKYRVIKSQFGDGFSQRTPDGINARVDSWNVVWENLSLTDYQTLTSFFDTVGTWSFFTWTPYTDAVSKNWIFTGNITTNIIAGNLYTVTAQVEQVYDLS